MDNRKWPETIEQMRHVILASLTRKIVANDNEYDALADDIVLSIAEAFGGLQIYLPKKDQILITERNQKIYSEFNGTNYDELALKYNMAEYSIRRIINDITDRKQTSIFDNQ